MVSEGFIGKFCEDGYIPAHSEYRLHLTEHVSDRMPYWKYYVNGKSPHSMTWNKGKYRYFDNVWMAQILLDIVSMKRHTGKRNSTELF